MLISLQLRDLVLVRQADLSFAPGFAVITGETGAGKSVLLDALGLLLGGRGDAGLVRHGGEKAGGQASEQASVTAHFQLSDDHPVHAVLQEMGLPGDDTLVLRRLVGRDGKSRAFVNDTAVSASGLKTVAVQVLELFGQFAQTRLTDTAEQRQLLDLYAGHAGGGGDLLRQVGAAYQQWRDAQAAEAAHAAEAAARTRDEEYIRFAVEELAALNPQEGEEAVLEEKRHRLQTLSKRQTGLKSALNLLQAPNGALSQLYQAQRQLDKLLDEPTLAAEAGLGEFGQAIDSIAGLAEAWSTAWARGGDPSELPALEDRLFALRDAARKHRVRVDDLPALLADWQQKLEALNHDAQQAGQLAAVVAAAASTYRQLAEQLSQQRQQAAQQLSQAVAGELPALKLGHARLEWRVVPQPPEMGSAHGIDLVSLWVAMNPATPLQPIAKVASGGELTRTMLALAMVLQGGVHAPTLLVDELDSGVSGAVAAAIGERLRRLGADRQILAVSHTPQVAAAAHHHYLVTKAVTGAGEKDVGADAGAAQDNADSATTPLLPLLASETTIRQLSDDQRREEIARLLSAERIHHSARDLADQLLAGNG
jgi:DNA repair protein RecN (Recombination protein N)